MDSKLKSVGQVLCATLVVSVALWPLTQYPVPVPGPKAFSSPSPRRPQRAQAPFLLPRKTYHAPVLRRLQQLRRSRRIVRSSIGASSAGAGSAAAEAQTRELGDSNDSSGGAAEHLSGVTIGPATCADRLNVSSDWGSDFWARLAERAEKTQLHQVSEKTA